MNFYKRFMADYARKTARLTLAQHGAYTLLLDELYTNEAPLSADMNELYRICRAMTPAERDAVKSVAEKFFPVAADGLRHNKRAHEELIEAAPAVEAARANGKKGGRPKKETQKEPTGFPNDNPEGTQNEPSSKAPQSLDKSNTPHTPKGAKTSAISLQVWLDNVKAAGEKPFPDDCAVFVYAEQVGIPSEFLRLAWLEFRNRYTLPDAKRYRDWRGVFHKAVRGNWLKLWWLDGEAYSLTTVGQQAKRAHEEKAA